MQNQRMIEPLEGRRMFDAVNVTLPDPQELKLSEADAVNLGQPFSISTLPPGSTIIRAGSNGSGLILFGTSGSRAGTFDLPTIKSDGSLRISGSEEDDTITVESVTGYSETYSGNKPTDGEHDFLHLIDPATGERFIITGIEVQNVDSSIKSYSSAVESSLRDLADMKSRPPSEERDESIAEIESQLKSDRKTVERYKIVKDQLDAGRFVRVSLAGVYDYYMQLPSEGLPSTARVTVDAGAGNDTVTISPNVPMKSTLIGGSGADVLTTGKKTTTVFAGGGKDRLINRSTKGATLDGGQGADRYFNKTASDVTIVGRDDGDELVTTLGSTRFDLSQVFSFRSINLPAEQLSELLQHGPSSVVDLVKPTV